MTGRGGVEEELFIGALLSLGLRYMKRDVCGLQGWLE